MLNITQTYAHMGKIANNLEKHGDDDVTAFDMPISEITLTAEQLNGLLDDPHADKALFNQVKSGGLEPTFRCFEPYRLKDSFDGAVVVFTVGKHEFTLADCKIQTVELAPENGGNTKLSFKLRVRPENDKQILSLLGHQNREVQIDIAEATVATKGGRKQQSLDLHPKANGPVIDGRAQVTDEEAAAAHTQALAASTKPSGRKAAGAH